MKGTGWFRTHLDTFTEFGVGRMFTRWRVYALAVGSLVALLLGRRRCK